MEYTAEQKAIRQFLSKPAPYGSACGCMGPQSIGPEKSDIFQLTINFEENRLEAIKLIHNYFKISLAEAKDKLEKNNVFDFEYDFQYKRLEEKLIEKNIKYTIKENPSMRYPVCPCAMSYVEEVDGQFYKIIENRSPDGITHQAILLGPVGGPYIKQ